MPFNSDDPRHTLAVDAIVKCGVDRATAKLALSAYFQSLGDQGVTLAEREPLQALIRTLDHLVSEFCKAVGEPVPVDAIAAITSQREQQGSQFMVPLNDILDLLERTPTFDPERCMSTNSPSDMAAIIKRRFSPESTE
jgi:hypothetical protein